MIIYVDIDGTICSHSAKNENEMPTVILANTIKGCGVSFMEANNEWHHNRITSSVYDRIFEEWSQNV